MAQGTLPKPGKRVKLNNKWIQIGPCVKTCNHSDCAETRKQAQSLCKICEKPIGYEIGFYQETNGQLVHSDCLLK